MKNSAPFRKGYNEDSILFHHLSKKLYLCEKVSNKILIMIKDFIFYAPTRVVFGRESEKKIGELVAACGGKKVRDCSTWCESSCVVQASHSANWVV